MASHSKEPDNNFLIEWRVGGNCTSLLRVGKGDQKKRLKQAAVAKSYVGGRQTKTYCRSREDN